jgi:hypothetical protein
VSPAAALVEERRRRLWSFGLLDPSSLSPVFFAAATDLWEFPGVVVLAARTTACGGDPVLRSGARRIVVSSSDGVGLVGWCVGGPQWRRRWEAACCLPRRRLPRRGFLVRLRLRLLQGSPLLLGVGPSGPQLVVCVINKSCSLWASERRRHAIDSPGRLKMSAPSWTSL